MNTRDIVLLATFVNALILGLLLIFSKGDEEQLTTQALSPAPIFEKVMVSAPIAITPEVVVAEAETISVAPAPLPVVPEEEWYVMRSGDNPWKVAKTHKIKFDDLLKLNGLNEERARNLKPGDRIRIR